MKDLLCHVYAIIRVDPDGILEGCNPVTMFTVTKILWSHEEAEREVNRLNDVNKPIGCRYYWQLTRLAKPQKGIDEILGISS